MADFDGLAVLVTGAATGLGAATAIGAARRGARVVVNYATSAKEAEATADACRQAGAEVIVVQGSVADDADCRRIAGAAAGWGRLDALVNNAGTTKQVPDHGDLDGLSAEDFQRLYAVNTIGPFQMVRACRALLEAGANASGRASAVVNISSVAGLNGAGSSVAYAASKGALNTMTLSLARALAPLIRVNAVCPGYMDTPWFGKGGMTQDAVDRLREAARAGVPLRVAATGEDVAESVLFLAGPASHTVTGDIMRVDAGAHLVTRTAQALIRGDAKR